MQAGAQALSRTPTERAWPVCGLNVPGFCLFLGHVAKGQRHVVAASMVSAEGQEDARHAHFAQSEMFR